MSTKARAQAAALPNRAEALRREIPVTARASDPEWEVSLWTETRAELRQRLANDDLTRFLSWDPVRRTLLISDPAHVRSVRATLKASGEWASRWRHVLSEDYVGLPQPTFRSPRSSGTLIHHAGLINAYEQHSGRRIETLSHIVEFGGGYGSMLRLICRLGFSGSYCIYDFPELGALQRLFYDLTVGAEAGLRQRSERPPTFASRMEDVPIDVAPAKGSAFIATWSLSETPIASREAWRRRLHGYQHFLFGYRDVFDGQDNVAWFARLQEERPDISWREIRPAGRARQVVLVGAGN